MKRNYIIKTNLAIFIIALVVTASIAKATTAKKSHFSSDKVKLIRVIDGDSFKAKITIWHQNEITTIIRLSGIDTPELRGKCAAEIELAQKAKAFTKKWLTTAPLYLTDIKPDKYNNRYIAIVWRENDKIDISTALLAAKLAQPYPSKKSWCD